MSVKIAGLMTLKNHRRFTFLERLLVIGTSLYATFTAGETVSFEVHIHDNESQISTNDTSTDDSVTVYVKVYHNEDPEFVYPWGKLFQIRETASDDRTIQTLEATDLDGDTLEYGIDESSEHPFQVVDGQIKLKPGATLDCETTPSYLLTYLVRDNKDADDGVDTRWDDELTLIMRVTNVDEAGTVTLGSSNALEVNAALSASLTDPDGSITDLTWQWQKADTVDATTWTDISGATGSSYTPVSGDAGKFIRAQAPTPTAKGPTKKLSAQLAMRYWPTPQPTGRRRSLKAPRPHGRSVRTRRPAHWWEPPSLPLTRNRRHFGLSVVGTE